MRWFCASLFQIATGGNITLVRVVGQFEKLTDYQYQRLAIRLRGAPATRDFRVVGMESRPLGRRHRASDEPVDKTVPLP